jgi:hypothetical protein
MLPKTEASRCTAPETGTTYSEALAGLHRLIVAEVQKFPADATWVRHLRHLVCIEQMLNGRDPERRQHQRPPPSLPAAGPRPRNASPQPCTLEPCWSPVGTAPDVTGFEHQLDIPQWNLRLRVLIYRKHVRHESPKNFQLDLFTPDDGHFEYYSVATNLALTLPALYAFIGGRARRRRRSPN